MRFFVQTALNEPRHVVYHSHHSRILNSHRANNPDRADALGQALDKEVRRPRVAVLHRGDVVEWIELAQEEPWVIEQYEESPPGA